MAEATAGWVEPRGCEMVVMLLVVLGAWLGASLPFGVLMGRLLRMAQPPLA
ncbi:MAG: hypothetical protein JOZ37_08625 [Actinobacteria bacterium]|nr:hypothetical protein [Actinomycetota bacterium]MBV9932764.1 hypothetical protein [Actinomycetota bacterium]